MRDRVSQVDYADEHYQDYELLSYSKSKKRLDLNDLLKRAKDQEKSDKKLKLVIFSCTAFAITALFLIVNI